MDPTIVAAAVNGTPIYREKVENRLQYHKISNQIAFTVLGYREEMIEKNQPENYDAVLEEMIEAEIFRQNLKKKALSHEQSKKVLEANRNLMYQQQEGFGDAVESTLKMFNLTKEQLEVLEEEKAYDLYCISTARSAYIKDIYDKKMPEKTVDDAFAEYQTKLRERAAVKIFDKPDQAASEASK